MYFIDVPIFYIEALNEKVYNPFRYFKKLFFIGLAKSVLNHSSIFSNLYYPYLKNYLDKEFNLYLRKEKLNKLNAL
jgi:hypothetical protein